MEAEARSGWDRLGELGEAGYRSTCGAALALALAWLGRDEEADAVADASEAMTSPDDFVTRIWAAAARSRMAANAGDAARAVDLARAAVAPTSTRDDVPNRAFALVVLVEALVAAGAAEEAAAVVREVEQLTRRPQSEALAERARSALAPAPRR